MLENLNAIKKRLGLERYKEAVAALTAGDKAQVCRIILDYYDRAYTHGLSLRKPETISYLPGDQAIAEIKRRI
jgi:tRNA 2-selenouridine synthase